MPATWQGESDSIADSSQKPTTGTNDSDNVKDQLDHLLQASALGATPPTNRTISDAATASHTEGYPDGAVLIFDREKRPNPLEETLQEKNVSKSRFIISEKPIVAVVGIVTLCWLIFYLPSKIVQGGQYLLSMYHNFVTRIHTMAHILRIGLTVAAWAGTMFGWGYLAKNTRKFIERRRSDLNTTNVNLNNSDAPLVTDRTDDYAPIDQYDKPLPAKNASFKGMIQVNNFTMNAATKS
jgi:hypothetical protein